MEHNAVLMELVGRSLDDIAQELATLRCEKSALEGETARLNALMPVGLRPGAAMSSDLTSCLVGTADIAEGECGL